MRDKPPFLMAGGGTGGHVIPALAVARELRRRGHQVFFVGTERGLEARLVPAEGFELRTIEIGGLNRVGARQKLETLARLPFVTLASLNYRASAVFSMGGYVAGPPVVAALVKRVPVVVMEPNAIPGFTNRAIGRLAARALIAFPETARYFARGNPELTGLPVREEFFAHSAQGAWRSVEPADHRRQPGVAHAQPGRPGKLAAVSRGGVSGSHRTPMRR